MKNNEAKSTEKKFGIHREDIGMSIHTSLRKACDSTPTSLAWNLINLEEMSSAWKEYLNLVWERIVALPKSPNDFGPTLKAAANDLNWGYSARAALKCTFELFDETDWSGAASYLTE